ncbi:MAG: DUF2974 domain-containing protein [Bacilli bacterium]|nr:DUF2974 domain-containing protein [Bacilli bacterium]
MYTIYDYLKYYKDYDINEVPWNDMDNLLLSTIVYIPIKGFMGTISFNEMCNKIMKFKVPDKTEYLAPKIKSLIEIINNSKRYNKLKFRNFENTIDNNTQFGAMTCIIDKIKIIVFKGTDRSIVGWLENFRLMYEYPTYTQSLAIKYLKNNIGLFDKNVYVTGHSKGGNMAMASVMELGDFKFNKVKRVINFDGPGFRKEEYDSPKYKKMSMKLTNIIPSNSYIGSLMFNNEYKVIKTIAHGINIHYPIYWATYGTEFIQDELSKLSQELHIRTSINIENIDSNSFREYFENAFKILNYKITSNISISISDMINIFKTIKGMDKKTTEYVNSVLKSMLKITNKNK